MENINSRFKRLREACGKNQTEWGEILGIKTSGVSDIENERRKVTEKHLIMLSNWKERHVNIDWLRTGEGGDENMFLKPQKNDLVAKAAMLLGQRDPVFEAFVETYSKLDPINREVLINWGIDFLNSLKRHSDDS